MRTSIKYSKYVIFGAFWVLFAIASAGYLWLILQVAKEDFAFFLPAMFWSSLIAMANTLAPLLLGVTMGLLIVKYLYGNDVVKQSICYGASIKGFFILFFILFPIYFISSFVLSIPIGALMDILSVPARVFISVGPVVGDYLTYTGDYLRFPGIISHIIVASAIAVVGGYVVRRRNQ